MRFIVVALLALVSMITAQSVASTELNAVPFGTLIGNPLNAIIDAQRVTAQTTMDFLNDVAFETADVAHDSNDDPLSVAGISTKKLRMMTFSYYKVDTNGTVNSFNMTLPFLYIIPVPFIQIKEGFISLNVKINSVDRFTSEQKLEFKASLSASANWAVARVQFNANVAFQASNKFSQNTEREYSTKIQVTVVQPPLPGGTSRILDLFETLVTSTTYSN